MLTAIDDSPDKFRIKIWETGGGIVCDNNAGADDGDNPTTTFGGGSIVVHTKHRRAR